MLLVSFHFRPRRRTQRRPRAPRPATNNEPPEADEEAKCETCQERALRAGKVAQETEAAHRKEGEGDQARESGEEGEGKRGEKEKE